MSNLIGMPSGMPEIHDEGRWVRIVRGIRRGSGESAPEVDQVLARMDPQGSLPKRTRRAAARKAAGQRIRERQANAPPVRMPKPIDHTTYARERLDMQAPYATISSEEDDVVALMESDTCRDPRHPLPPVDRPMEPGHYSHTCPACGEITRLIVDDLEADAEPDPVPTNPFEGVSTADLLLRLRERQVVSLNAYDLHEMRQSVQARPPTLDTEECLRRIERRLRLVVGGNPEITRYGSQRDLRGDDLRAVYAEKPGPYEESWFPSARRFWQAGVAMKASARAWEKALSDARASGNLSAARVTEYLRLQTEEHESPDPAAARPKRKFDSNAIVRNIMGEMHGLAGPALDLIEFDELDRGQIDGWLTVFDNSMRRLRQLRKSLAVIKQEAKAKGSE